MRAGTRRVLAEEPVTARIRRKEPTAVVEDVEMATDKQVAGLGG
jgi:hypothetical protein